LGDREHDGFHPAGSLSGDINLSLWCSCGCSGFSSNGACCVTQSSYRGTLLATCSWGEAFTVTLGLCASY